MHDGVGEQLLDHQRQAQAVACRDAAIGAERLDERDRLGKALHAGEDECSRQPRPSSLLSRGLSSPLFMPRRSELGGRPHDEDVFAPARPRPGSSSRLRSGSRFPAHADVGQIKVATGQVFVDRKGQSLPGRVGLVLETDDVAEDRRRRLGGHHHARQLPAVGRAEQHPVPGALRVRRRRPARAASTPACSAARSPWSRAASPRSRRRR